MNSAHICNRDHSGTHDHLCSQDILVLQMFLKNINSERACIQITNVSLDAYLPNLQVY